MRYHDLMWKGRLASELGVIVTDQVAYHRPALRKEAVTIPGRSGTVHMLGDDAWDEVVYAPGCALKPVADPEAVWAWLRGSGRVTFGSMPEYAFDARLDDAFDCSELVAAHPAGYLLFTPVFVCQPRRYEVIPTAAFALNGGERRNPGTLAAEPVIRVTATAGAVVALSLQSGEKLTVTVPPGEGSKTVVIDMGMEVALCDGTRAATAGEFFRLPVGFYTLAATAVSGQLLEATVEPRYCWL